MMARGFLSKQWVHVIHPSRNPPRVTVKLQWPIWLDFLTHSGRTEMTYSTTQPTYTPKKMTANSPKESRGTAKIDTNYSNTTAGTSPTSLTFQHSRQCLPTKSKSGYVTLRSQKRIQHRMTPCKTDIHPGIYDPKTITSVDDMLGDGVALSTPTKRVVFIIFLVLWCRSLRSCARALDR